MSIKNVLKGAVKSLPPIKSLVLHRDQLLEEREGLLLEVEKVRSSVSDLHSAVSARDDAIRSLQEMLAVFGEGPPFVPNGHFYSPIASRSEIARDDAKIFTALPDSIPGIDLRVEQQLALLAELRKFYDDLPFADDKQVGLRYHYDNTAYSFSDGIFLNAMLRHLRPRRAIEIGSGFTSAMFLDTNERWLDNRVHLTFIEPYPDLLYSLLMEGDREKVIIHPSRLQDVDLQVFSELESGDILFIDSTHVSRVGSDVNYIFFQILPRLAPGVHIHFHDIFFPFEYPKTWILEGRAWNELYVLRAFLQFNSAFEIVLFNTYLEAKFPDYFLREMPLCMRNTGGSIWLRKV